MPTPEERAAWLEVATRLDDAWRARGDDAEDDIDMLRALCGEALMVVRDLDARLRATPPVPSEGLRNEVATIIASDVSSAGWAHRAADRILALVLGRAGSEGSPGA